MTRYIVHLRFTTRVVLVNAECSSDAVYAAMTFGLVSHVEVMK